MSHFRSPFSAVPPKECYYCDFCTREEKIQLISHCFSVWVLFVIQKRRVKIKLFSFPFYPLRRLFLKLTHTTFSLSCAYSLAPYSFSILPKITDKKLPSELQVWLNRAPISNLSAKDSAATSKTTSPISGDMNHNICPVTGFEK